VGGASSKYRALILGRRASYFREKIGKKEGKINKNSKKSIRI
jgi:hypothetical protein